MLSFCSLFLLPASFPSASHHPDLASILARMTWVQKWWQYPQKGDSAGSRGRGEVPAASWRAWHHCSPRVCSWGLALPAWGCCLEIENSDLILATYYFLCWVCLDYILIPSVPLYVRIWPSVNVINMKKCKGELCLPRPRSKNTAVLSHDPCSTPSSSHVEFLTWRLDFGSSTNLNHYRQCLNSLSFSVSIVWVTFSDTFPLGSHLSLGFLPSLLGALVSSFTVTTLGLQSWLWEVIGAKCDVNCNCGSCILKHPCQLSCGTVESLPEWGVLLQHHLPVAVLNVVYSMLWFGVVVGVFCCCYVFSPWETKPDGTKGQVWSQTDTVPLPLPLVQMPGASDSCDIG